MIRAGRFGSHGIAISFVSGNTEMEKFRKMLGDIGGDQMSVMELPTDQHLHDLWNYDSIEDSKKCFGKTNEATPTEDDKIISENLAILEMTKCLVNSDVPKPQIDFQSLLADYANCSLNKKDEQKKIDEIIPDPKSESDESEDLNMKNRVVFSRSHDEDESTSDSENEYENEDFSEDSESSEEFPEIHKKEKVEKFEGIENNNWFNQYCENQQQKWLNICQFQFSTIANHSKFSRSFSSK